MNWILNNLLGSVILIVIVLFQDDLRRALIKVGLIGGFSGESLGQVESTLVEVSSAALSLAKKRKGALIVLQREIGLEEYTEHAISIEAHVSRQLLEAIFQSDSPLHDGAVIIDHGRILAAGSVLPLTFNPKIRKDLGTRHRAALGLSERSDAVVIVVSEERASVSAVYEGKIFFNLSEEGLVSVLKDLIVSEKRNFFQNYFFEKTSQPKTEEKRAEFEVVIPPESEVSESENGSKLVGEEDALEPDLEENGAEEFKEQAEQRTE